MEDKKQMLLELGETDKQLFSYQNKLETLPAKLEKSKAVLVKIVRKKEKLEKKDQIVLKKMGERNKLIAIEQTRSEVAEKKMTKVSSQDDYISLKKQKETAGKVVAELEKQNFTLEESRKEWGEDLGQVMEDFGKAEKSCSKKEKNLKEGTAELQINIDELHESRKKILAGMDKRLVENYGKITNSKLYPSVVKLIGTTCSGCAMGLPPQEFQEILKRGGIGQCSHCRRFLILPDEDMKEKVEVKKPKKPKKAVKKTAKKVVKKKVEKVAEAE